MNTSHQSSKNTYMPSHNWVFDSARSVINIHEEELLEFILSRSWCDGCIEYLVVFTFLLLDQNQLLFITTFHFNQEREQSVRIRSNLKLFCCLVVASGLAEREKDFINQSIYRPTFPIKFGVKEVILLHAKMYIAGITVFTNMRNNSSAYETCIHTYNSFSSLFFPSLDFDDSIKTLIVPFFNHNSSCTLQSPHTDIHSHAVQFIWALW